MATARRESPRPLLPLSPRPALLLGRAWLARFRVDKTLERLGRLQRSLVPLLGKSQDRLQFGVRIGSPEFLHRLLHRRVEPPDSGCALRHDHDEDLASVGLVTLAAYEARLLQPVDHASDRAGREA